MGVKTGDIFKGFTFDGEASKDYGVYITGAGVYNAPERDVNMISIPGRDGAFAQDLGRFSNITVTYPAGLFGVDPADFAQAISDFRNMLASRRGYCRLTDDYNAGEYRLAVFKAGVEVTPASLESGEFNVTFDCKPQRWLTSGEDAVALTSGDTINNPTLFESSPLLEVDGYGGIKMGESLMQVNSVPIGIIDITYTRSVAYSDQPSNGIKSSYTITFDDTLLNNTDPVSISGLVSVYRYDSSYTVTNATADHPNAWTIDRYASNMVAATTSIDISFDYGTSASGSAGPESITITATSGGTTYTGVVTASINWSYTGSDTLTIDVYQFTNSVAWASNHGAGYINPFSMTGNSSKSALGSPLYFDLDIGEAYKIENDVPVSVNNAVTIPATLPTLPPGNTTVTFDNTITQFKIAPRWWKV